jgi:hypothetical protein
MRRVVPAVVILVAGTGLFSCCTSPHPTPTATATLTPTATPSPTVSAPVDGYPWHTNIVSTTFWVGEIFDPSASDGSQVISTYDSRWYSDYGGCDGVIRSGVCSTEPRSAANGFFPLAMQPKENPFYLDLPFDDVNDAAAFASRGRVVPWANSPAYAGSLSDPSVSLMKNRWVELTRGSATCFGQIEDAGPGEYDDARYVFGTDDARPQNTRYGGAGLDVSPALNGCLEFAELDGDSDRLDWRFIESDQVPAGPWLRIVTTTPVHE